MLDTNDVNRMRNRANASLFKKERNRNVSMVTYAADNTEDDDDGGGGDAMVRSPAAGHRDVPTSLGGKQLNVMTYEQNNRPSMSSTSEWQSVYAVAYLIFLF